MAHAELNLRERRMIEDMLNAKMSVREIATKIGRHVSTIYETSNATARLMMNCRN